MVENTSSAPVHMHLTKIENQELRNRQPLSSLRHLGTSSAEP